MMLDVTGTSDNAGRGWQAVLAAGLAVLTAATITAFVGTRDPAAEDTIVAAVRNAALVTAGGAVRAAKIGDVVPAGDTLRTGEGGGARLNTSGRDVYVGALSTVTVNDGVHQNLTRGQVMVDTRKGPALQLGTRAGDVHADEGALARVETGAALRLAVLDGAATFTAAGRKATSTVSRYYQVRVPYGAVAGRATALALTPDDGWERDLAAGLVAADADLNRLELSLDGSDGLTVLAALRTAAVADVAPGIERREQALGAALAEAAGRVDSVITVKQARVEGGSWGVVAAIAGARVTTVSALLDRLLTPGAVLNAAQLLAGPFSNVIGLLGGPPGLTDSGNSAPSQRPSGPGPAASPSASPTPRPTDNPSQPDPANSMLGTLMNLLPTPTPTPSITPTPTPSLTKTPTTPTTPTTPPGATPVVPTSTAPPLFGLDLRLGALQR